MPACIMTGHFDFRIMQMENNVRWYVAIGHCVMSALIASTAIICFDVISPFIPELLLPLDDRAPHPSPPGLLPRQKGLAYFHLNSKPWLARLTGKTEMITWQRTFMRGCASRFGLVSKSLCSKLVTWVAVVYKTNEDPRCVRISMLPIRSHIIQLSIAWEDTEICTDFHFPPVCLDMPDQYSDLHRMRSYK